MFFCNVKKTLLDGMNKIKVSFSGRFWQKTVGGERCTIGLFKKNYKLNIPFDREFCKLSESLQIFGDQTNGTKVINTSTYSEPRTLRTLVMAVCEQSIHKETVLSRSNCS